MITEAPTAYLRSQVAVTGSSRWTFWIGKGSLAILDQGLIAISNFLSGVLLARWLSPQQYGSYALAFAIFLLLSLAYQAILLEPQRIFGPTDYSDCRREYLGVLLRIHCGIALAILLALGVYVGLMPLSAKADGMLGALAGVILAAPCILLLWLARGAFYIRMSPQHAVAGAAVYCFVLFTSLWVLYKAQLLSTFSAFLAMASAAFISSAVLLLLLRPDLKLRMTGRGSWAVFQQHWNYGRWILLSSLLSWLSGDVYIPVITSFSGLAAAGELKVLLNFSLPVAQTFNALSVFVLPYATRLQRNDGPTALTGFTWKMATLFSAAALAYWSIVIALGRPIIHLLYGSRYSEIASLIPWVAAASLPWNVAYVPAMALRAIRSSASIMVMYSASAIIAVLIGIPATSMFGLRGALWAMVLSNSIALFSAFFLVNRKLRKNE